MGKLRPGIWRHFKGNAYHVIGEASHSENGKVYVVYRKLYDDYALLIRPKSMFIDRVKRKNYEGPRFWFEADA